MINTRKLVLCVGKVRGDNDTSNGDDRGYPMVRSSQYDERIRGVIEGAIWIKREKEMLNYIEKCIY